MKPVLQALLLADKVYEEKNGKKIMCGTFSGTTINNLQAIQKQIAAGHASRPVPGGSDAGSPSVYLSLTDVVDGTKIDIEIVNRNKNTIVLQTALTIKSGDRFKSHEFAIALPAVTTFIREPGIHSMDAIWNGEILGSHRLVVEEFTPFPESRDAGN